MIRSESKQKSPSRTCAYGHGIMPPCRQDISRAFNILVELEATQYLYSIQYSSRIKKIQIFDLSEILDSLIVHTPRGYLV